ncbi:two-component sensor histidine kinase [Deinococcus piscis]|uniref:histidine kinase n=1 Tax=Deinococcus piscis TaxID=394230 RepID=A0ABQ3JZU0_9DEIO|nr:HAMP domain-containing sensor histidine kinase [Deinococcus piscis]GHF93703.1 two-component sensor histidine kinase [Deinococcus piscis]
MRPLRIPLAWQLALAFFVVSTLALGSVGVLSAALTRDQFRTLLSDQERQRIETQLHTHLQAGGTLATFSPEQPEHLGSGPAGTGPQGSRADRPGRRTLFVLTDPQFRPVGPDTRPLTGSERAQAVPVEVSGQKVGYLVPRGRPDIEGANAAFLRRTTQAIAWATAASGLLAALLGGWLARRLLRPLTQLRGGIAALSRGEEPTPLPPRPVQDELSDLLGSFRAMHAEVVRTQQAGRQLTADIAHDLNTPLTVIRGGLEAMLDGTFQPTPARLSRLNDQAGRMARLVADLRLLAQTDSGELPLHPRPVAVAELLTEAAQAFAGVAAQRGSALRLDAPADLRVTADPDRLRQVLDNLIGNALNHAPGTPVTLRARAEAGGVTLQVQDAGPGVAPQDLPHLFERLYRADPSRHAAGLGAGSGLGLSISRGVVQAHGGHIRARNVPEGGLCIELWLPGEAGPEGDKGAS